MQLIGNEITGPKLNITSTYQQKRADKKPVISSSPSFETELHVSAIYL